MINWVDLDIPPHLRKICKAIPLEELTCDLISARAEAAMVWDPAASQARLLGHRIGRGYDKHGRKYGEIAGSADVVAFHRTLGHPVVVDYKTGRHIGPVSDSWQMRFLALMTAHVAGWSRCEARVAYIGWKGELRVESHMFDAMDLDSDSVSISKIIDRIKDAEKLVQIGETSPFYLGEHCDRMYCPARPHCKVYKGKAAA